MNPKMSDFGLARILKRDQSTKNTRRIWIHRLEYVIDGNFSLKSDVFSFGILLLEIAWNLWMEGRPLDLISEDLKESYNGSEALRCIHISFLCLQQHPHDRPTMSSVVMMLGSQIYLPKPKQPALFIGQHSSLNQSSLPSVNELILFVNF
ncbi:hypothetical protein Ahy_B08g093013 [Arachis hypogaea]|uniref:Protein kinase domain-containing protein n=1 Tax=Arachis hypogaea TaxID=3818 RepID=A0A444Y546_ARAHY|nr:hypothetical protein Ahy_B08g093013 [Arachis hypogaea]